MCYVASLWLSQYLLNQIFLRAGHLFDQTLKIPSSPIGLLSSSNSSYICSMTQDEAIWNLLILIDQYAWAISHFSVTLGTLNLLQIKCPFFKNRLIAGGCYLTLILVTIKQHIMSDLRSSQFLYSSAFFQWFGLLSVCDRIVTKIELLPFAWVSFLDNGLNLFRVILFLLIHSNLAIFNLIFVL